jgi:hypothetical protein
MYVSCATRRHCRANLAGKAYPTDYLMSSCRLKSARSKRTLGLPDISIISFTACSAFRLSRHTKYDFRTFNTDKLLGNGLANRPGDHENPDGLNSWQRFPSTQFIM